MIIQKKTIIPAIPLILSVIFVNLFLNKKQEQKKIKTSNSTQEISNQDSQIEYSKEIYTERNVPENFSMLSDKNNRDFFRNKEEVDSYNKEIEEKIESQSMSEEEIEEVLVKSGKIKKPYSTPEEKQEVLNKLNKTLNFFDRKINMISKNVNDAVREGSRTEEEIEEAQEALEEMKKGKEFVKERIDMVEKDNSI